MNDEKNRLAEAAELAALRWRRIRKLRRDIAAAPAKTDPGLRTKVPPYFFRERMLLVPDEHRERVAQVLARLKIGVRPNDVETEDVSVFELTGDGETNVPRVVARVRRELGDEGAITPEHVFFPTPWHTLGPATEPDVPPGTEFRATNEKAGAGVRVAIVDTGLLKAPPVSWYQSNVNLGPGAVEDPDFDNNGYIDPVAGHGTFIAGLIHQVAPAAELYIEQVIDQAGVISELELAARLHRVLDDPPDIINLSLGGHTDVSNGPIALRSVWKRILQQDPRIVVVAAAGNTASPAPFFPAATKAAIGVGALGVDGKRAWFSNYGDWVDVWAPGEDLQSNYAEGDYQPRPPESPRAFSGTAKWSGTSFATPVVVGAIAAVKSEANVSAREASDIVVRRAARGFDPADFGLV